MRCFLKNQTGFALIGLLIVIVIIAALGYGSSFFWKHNTKGTIQNNLEIKKKAEQDIGEINKKIEKYNSELATSTKE